MIDYSERNVLGPPARASSWVKQNQMAPSVKSFSELQRQLIGAELGRREAASRKATSDAWLQAFDDVATAPPVLKVSKIDR